MNFDTVQLLQGDWRFFWPETLRDLASMPFAWDSFLNTGIGQPALGTLWITSYLHLTSFLSFFGFSWFWIGLFFWQLPIFIFSAVGMYKLSQRAFGYSRIYSILSCFLYVANTYFLMLFLGGQLGVCLAYGLLPLVLLKGINVIDKPILSKSIVFGCFLSLLLLFDPRVFFLSLLALFFYGLLSIKKKVMFKQSLFAVVLPGLVVFSLHLFWIVPLLIFKTSGVSSKVGSLADFQFLSFAGFEYGFSWLHPNWPENIFGKILFLNPLFLIFPLTAFGSLLFVKKENKKMVLFFVFLAIIAIFLAKGARDPFSTINLFLFQYFPGMQMFRDSTKFYILISLSYALLIPFTLSSLSKVLEAKVMNKITIKFGLLLLFVILCFIILLPISQGKKRLLVKVPESYQLLHIYLVKQEQYSRTLWLPEWQRYGYFSANHPAIGRNELLKDTTIDGVRQFFAKKNAEQLLKDSSVRFVIVPEDSEKELFLDDRKYSEKKRQEYIKVLDHVSWLKKDMTFDPIIVYRITDPHDHFFLVNQSVKLISTYNNSSRYLVRGEHGTIKGNLVFAESFSPYWTANIHNKTIPSTRDRGMNRFVLPEHTKDVTIEYEPQKTVNVFLFVTLTSLVIWISIIVYKKKYV